MTVTDPPGNQAPVARLAVAPTSPFVDHRDPALRGGLGRRGDAVARPDLPVELRRRRLDPRRQRPRGADRVREARVAHDPAHRHRRRGQVRHRLAAGPGPPGDPLLVPERRPDGQLAPGPPAAGAEGRLLRQPRAARRQGHDDDVVPGAAGRRLPRPVHPRRRGGGLHRRQAGGHRVLPQRRRDPEDPTSTGCSRAWATAGTRSGSWSPAAGPTWRASWSSGDALIG